MYTNVIVHNSISQIKDECDNLVKIRGILQNSINRIDFNLTILQYKNLSIEDVITLVCEVLFLVIVIQAIIDKIKQIHSMVIPETKTIFNPTIFLN